MASATITNLRSLDLIARRAHQNIVDDRERLISNIEWFVRDLTREAERLKTDPTYMPSRSLMTGSLPHEIARFAEAINVRAELLGDFVDVLADEGVPLTVRVES